MTAYQLRHDWIGRVRGLTASSVQNEYLVEYEPGDSTHYAMSLTKARWAALSGRLGCHANLYWQASVWSGSGKGNGTVLVPAGDSGKCVAERGWLTDELRCSEYSGQVFAVMIHGCLLSHDLSVAQEYIAHFREAGRLGFVDPDVDS